MSRIYSIDVFKIITSYGVVLYHTVMLCWALMIEQSPLVTGIPHDLFMNVVMVARPLLQWVVPSLFLISGYLIFKISDFSDIKKYYKIYLSPLVIATVITLLLYLLQYICEGKVVSYIHDLSLNILGMSNMWFIYSMLLMYILVPYINYIKKRYSSKTMLSMIVIVYFILVVLDAMSYSDLLCSILRIFIHIIIFTLGGYIDYIIEYLDSKKKILNTIILTIILLIIIFFVTYHIIVIKEDYESSLFYLFANTHPHSIFAVLSAILITPLIFKIKTSIHIKDASIKMLIIYLIHPFVIDILGKVLTYSSIFSVIVNSIINYVVTYIITCVTIMLINKAFCRKKV